MPDVLSAAASASLACGEEAPGAKMFALPTGAA